MTEKVFEQNRMHNAKNPNQGEDKRVLCVCSAGLLRSPTAAFVLAQKYGYNTRAAGAMKEWALIPVDKVLIHWADEIVCMTEEHKNILIERFSPVERKIVVLNVPDRFERMDPILQTLILEAYEKETGNGPVQNPRSE